MNECERKVGVLPKEWERGEGGMALYSKVILLVLPVCCKLVPAVCWLLAAHCLWLEALLRRWKLYLLIWSWKSLTRRRSFVSLYGHESVCGCFLLIAIRAVESHVSYEGSGRFGESSRIFECFGKVNHNLGTIQMSKCNLDVTGGCSLLSLLSSASGWRYRRIRPSDSPPSFEV